MSLINKDSRLDLDKKKGPAFADYRNTAYNGHGEPSPNRIDTVPEFSLGRGYRYGSGADAVSVYPSKISLKGKTPSQYKNNGPKDGRY